jgi:uncharacterized Zn finger protein
MWWSRYGGGWPEYVPVHKRIESAKKRAAKRAKAFGRQPEPVAITGTGIARTFWGKAWCRNLESYSDFSNRLPRGRTYARNGSVVDLLVTRGRVEAIVAGSTVYDVAIAIAPLSPVKWRAIKTDCASSIGSLVDLLTGRLDDDVIRRLVKPGEGMFPSPREVNVKCSCPDGARLCKHLAAVLYGVGARLDTRPELLFLLRGVEQTDLVAAATKESVSRAIRGDDAHALAAGDLPAIFGIDLDGAAPASSLSRAANRGKTAHPAKPAKATRPRTAKPQEKEGKPQKQRGKKRQQKTAPRSKPPRPRKAASHDKTATKRKPRPRRK